MKLKAKTGILILAAIFLVAGVFGVATAKKYSKKHSSKTPWLGVYLQDIDSDLAETFDLDNKDGALIADVIDDSPAEEAGLKEKDIIIKFDGKGVTDPDELTDLVDDTEIGSEVEIVYIRKGKEQTTKAKIDGRPKSERRNISFFTPRGHSKGNTYYFSGDDHGFIGVGIQDLNDQLGNYFGVKDGDGVLVTEVYEDSPAEKAGLKAGDIIIGAGGEEIVDSSELQEIIGERKEGDTVEIVYLRKGSKSTVKVEVEEKSYYSDSFTIPSIPRIPNIPKIPKIPNIKWYGNNWDDDDHEVYIEHQEGFEEYQDEMEELREELQQMQKELQDIRTKLE